MTASSFDWDEELPPETATEVYQALLRGLQRKQGFGLFFVQCSPDQGKKLVADLRRDLPWQRIVELHLQGEVVTLYDQVEQLWQQQPFDVLVLQGLQASIYAYEDARRLSGWSSSEIYQYSWKGVPHILNHLNQQREWFRNDFPARFVFLVPPFVVDYFIQRAADFLDWRSGLFCFPRDPGEIDQEVDPFVGGNYDQYLALPPPERIEKILHLKSLQDTCPDAERKAGLLSELGLLFAAEQDYENAAISWDKAIEINPDLHQTWNARGLALSALGRYEEAIASYERAVAINPDFHEAWYNRGAALSALGRKEEAVVSYERAVVIHPDDHQAWAARGNALYHLGRYEEALTSYERAVAINPDDHEAWYARGVALYHLGRYAEAVASYERAIAIHPDDHDAWYNRGKALSALGRYEEAIASYEQAVTIHPDDHEAWYSKACCTRLTGKGGSSDREPATRHQP